MNNTARAVVLAVNVADYDGDGFNDVAVGAKEDTLQGSAGWVYLLNNDGSVKWEHDTPGAISAMISSDLSGNGKPQIIAGVSSRIYIFDGEGNAKQVSLGDLAYKASVMIADDINKDGAKELVVAGCRFQEERQNPLKKHENRNTTRFQPRCRYTGTYSAQCSAMQRCKRRQNMCLLSSKYSNRNFPLHY